MGALRQWASKMGASQSAPPYESVPTFAVIDFDSPRYASPLCKDPACKHTTPTPRLLTINTHTQKAVLQATCQQTYNGMAGTFRPLCTVCRRDNMLHIVLQAKPDYCCCYKIGTVGFDEQTRHYCTDCLTAAFPMISREQLSTLIDKQP